MTNLPLAIACGDYDRTRALQDGRVPIVGCDVTYLALPPEEIMFRAVKYDEFDVAELSLSSYIMEKARGDTNYIALPVPVSRVFRHSSIYIRTDRGINSPEDLKGKIVGIPEIGYPLRSRDVNMLGWRTRHPIPKAGSTTRAP